MKTELPWLREVSAPSLQQTGRALDTAYRNWFDSLLGKRPDKVKPPTFKKKSSRQSARFARNSFRSIALTKVDPHLCSDNWPTNRFTANVLSAVCLCFSPSWGGGRL